MPKNNLESELQARVEAFVADLSKLVREAAFETVRQALGGVAAPAPRRARQAPRLAKKAKKSAGRGGRGRVRRSSEDLESLANALLSHVKQNPGQRLEQIGADMRIDTKELKRPVQLLLEAGALRTEGQRRGTKYFAGGGGGASKKRGAKGSKRKTGKKKRKAGRRKTSASKAAKAAA